MSAKTASHDEKGAMRWIVSVGKDSKQDLDEAILLHGNLEMNL
jgi:hypothetical protein